MDANARRTGGRRGTYEVWYVKAVEPASRFGFWARVTTLAPRPGSTLDPRAEAWAFAFTERGIRARKTTVPLDALEAAAAPFRVAAAGCEVRSDGARGALGDGVLAWDLRWEPAAEPYRPYPYRWMERAAWPRTKLLAATPDARVSGSVTVEGERFALRGAPGEQAHVWGTRHAHEWAWCHANAFADGDGALFAGLSAFPERGRGPFTLLHVRAGEGRRWSFRGIRSMLRARSAFAPGRWAFYAEARGARLKGVASAPPDRIAAVEYVDPDGSSRFCHHAEHADLELTVQERGPTGWRDAARLRCEAAAALEYGGPRHDASVPRVL